MHFEQYGSGEVFIWSRLSGVELGNLHHKAMRSKLVYGRWFMLLRFIFLYIGVPVLVVSGVVAVFESTIGSYYHVGLTVMAATAVIEILLMMAMGYISYLDKNSRAEYREMVDASRVEVPRALLHVMTRYFRGEYPTYRGLDMTRAMEPLGRDYAAAMEWIEKSPQHFDSILRVVSDVARAIDNHKQHEIRGWYWIDYGLYTRLFEVLMPQLVDMSDRIVRNKSQTDKTNGQIQIGRRLDKIDTDRTMDKLRSDVAELQQYVDEFTATQKVA